MSEQSASTSLQNIQRNLMEAQANAYKLRRALENAEEVVKQCEQVINGAQLGKRFADEVAEAADEEPNE
jgi:hypothetical protein